LLSATTTTTSDVQPLTTTSAFLSATTTTTSVGQPITTSNAFLSATTTTTSDAQSITTTSEGDSTWKAWDGKGVTFHSTEDYEVETLCAANHDMLHMCWYIDDTWVADESPCQDDFTCQQAKEFQENSLLSRFCQRTDHIAFGHPVDVLCGECVEVRVQRADGNFNTVTVMQVDNPRVGRLGVAGDTSSPELSKAAKIELTEGVVLPDGRQAELMDRLPFEYRVVPCV
jgi:hypothetical protein